MGEEEEDEVAASDVVRALHGVLGKEIAHILIGCEFYEDDPDDLFVISAISERSVEVVDALGECRAVPFSRFRLGYVLDRRERPMLLASLNNSKPEVVKREEEWDKRLRAEGVDPRLIDFSDKSRILEIIQKARAENGISRNEVHPAYELLATYGLYAIAVDFIETYLIQHPSRATPDIHVKLACSWRHSNRLGCKEAALSIADERHLRAMGYTMSNHVISILNTERAAILLDIYDKRRDPQLITDARRCAGRAWANEKSEECSNLYERLKIYEDRLGGRN